jgi:cobaltochelatase CobN
VILFLTTADTEILALRSLLEGLPADFPAVRAANPVAGALPSLDGVRCVLVRLLGGRRAWEAGFDRLRAACLARHVPLLAFGGEAAPDAELTRLSTVPSATVAQAFGYLVHGGLDNLEQLLRFVAGAVLKQGWGFDPPVAVPECGVWPLTQPTPPAFVSGRPSVGIIFYRAHVLSGNTVFVDDLCAAVDAAGANPVAVWCYSLRPGSDGRVAAVDLLASVGVDAVITTVLAAGSADGDEGEGWDAGELAALRVPVIQAITATQPSAAWEEGTHGLTPVDVAMAVAIPEFDGRLITVPFSFKEVVDEGDELGTAVTAYRTVSDRVARVAGVAVRLAGLGRVPVAERRVAVVLSAYPTKRSRIGNAVALDTPASVIALLARLRDAGYRVERIPADGDALMAELIDAFSYERASLTAAQLARAPGRWSGAAYVDWWRSGAVPARAAALVESTWGEPPGTVYVDPGSGDLVFPGLDLGGVFVTVQPPRGFGEDPIAVYHSPDLAPTHHYLAFYRWLDAGWGADAIVHAGKHGTLEWLPGKGVGLSASCFPDLALGSVPLIYPFVVNDPGEGTQAKRRAHAVIVDHLLPPMTRAETYDDLARLEALLDAYAQVAALDPTKLPAIRTQIWELMVNASLHDDLGLAERPADDEFDAAILHVDGYLCELKDAQIRGGLHVLGQAPIGEAELDLVLALTRLAQGGVPSLRATVAARLGTSADALTATSVAVPSPATVPAMGRRQAVDAVEAECRRLLADLQSAGWSVDAAEVTGDPTLLWVTRTLVPALARTPDELEHIVDALGGRAVAPGPSGAPTRGMAHVLPTGRNFYSVDPKAIPSRLAWGVGQALADALIARHLAEEGHYPATVGLVVWGTAAMRTAGDDVAEILALLGVRPLWAEESARVVGLEVVPLCELGRPRIDVTVRISGFFRDAFPHLVYLMESAVTMVAALTEEGPDDNFVRAHGADDPRLYGAKPGAYGSGILAVLDNHDWRSDDDLAAVYQAWSGYSYGRAGMGLPAADAMARRFAAIDVAVKNQDNREHDIFDSDDYLQDHGGMIATIRALTGVQPKAWFGDSADPSNPRVRSLAEEAARVVRTRVVNPKWIAAMEQHGYKGAFEMAATVDYLFGYDATAQVVEDWMYEKVTEAYVADATVRKFFEKSNPWALQSIAERLLEAAERGMWRATDESLATLRSALLEAEGWEEGR